MMTAYAGGFCNPVFDSQRIFRAVMDATARPGFIHKLEAGLEPPAPLTPELAAIALALADHDSPLWLDTHLCAEPVVADYLRFHTGATIVEDPEKAAFALIARPADCPGIDTFAIGVPEYPDRSTTLIFAVDQLANTPDLRLSGPGINGSRLFSAQPLPRNFISSMQANRILFPLGIDCLFVARGQVAALPRSSSVISER